MKGFFDGKLEYVFIGWLNVGKFLFINMLMGKKDLVKMLGKFGKM